MKFALSTKSFRQFSLEQSIQSIAKAGFKNLDILAQKPHINPGDFTAAYAAQIQRALQDNKLTVVALDAYGPPDFNPSWLAEDWKEREERIRYTLDCARIAAALGIKYVTIPAGSPIPESMDYNEAWRLFVANMFRVLSTVGRLGITILLRPSPDILISTADQAIAFLRELEFPENLKIAFDPAHARCAGEDPCSTIQAILPQTACIYLSDVVCSESHSHVPIGEGELDVKAFLNCLMEASFDGYIIIDPASAEQPSQESLESLNKWLKENDFF
ncbi:sugar phosphate isomerase/epimerase family protein [Thermodesulforhabdus norvegica]|uniref:Sugar phosphate isomerase/epimerase n=1 Tax=Thermodesulforhabdus norvegica TaxID=39841 RepID=A0A1I4UWQ2_9BACT|nr:sugar phosphate isomerase/epimerase family protein [Thermodesulforhabdus norvegica]SFM93193.1 Sugar phosphate isomerase/epimerase [Thermodesulforhabdus norvegica]